MKNPRAGFTLLEVLVAALIFGLAIFAIVQSRTSSLRNVSDSETLFKAIQAAQSKMTEMELKYQKALNKDGMTGSFNKDAGTFEPPFEGFTWTAELAETTLKLEREDLIKLLTDLGIEKEEAEASAEDPKQRIVITNLNKLMKENLAELRVTVSWEKFGHKKTLPLITHLIPDKVKVNITMVAE